MEQKNKKIAVVGIGGVGGAIAAMLIKKYGDQVSLIARGARKEKLLKDGLTIHGEFTGSFTVQPARVTERPSELGEQDVVLVCVKQNMLSQTAQEIWPMVGENTLVLPVMNGVTPYRQLRGELETGIVLPSVIYIESFAGKDYSITQTGNYMEVHTGVMPGQDVYAEAAQEVCRMFADSGINWQYSEDVIADIWKKYVLNCAYNVMTARWGCQIGEIKADPQKREDYRILMEEAKAVGTAHGVSLPDGLVEGYMERLENTPDTSDSSLNRDFAEGKAGEYEMFSGDLVLMAAAEGVPVPVMETYYSALKEIASGFGN